MTLLSQDTRTDIGTDMDADDLFRLHSRFVASFLFRLGVGRSELDDWVQEVFLVAHRRGGYVAGPARPTTWLAAICLRVAMKARDQRQRGQRFTIQDDVAGEDLPSPSSSPFDTLAAQQRLRWLLGRMEPERRAVFLLFEVEGENCDAIADALDVPVGTVYSRLHAARRDFNEGYSRLEAMEKSGASPPGRTIVSDPIRLRDDASTSKGRQRLLRMGSVEHDLGFDETAGLARLRASIDSGSAIRTRASRPRLFAPLMRMARYAAVPALWVWLTLPAAAAAGWWAVHHAPTVWQHLYAPPALPQIQPPTVSPTTSPIPAAPGPSYEVPVPTDDIPRAADPAEAQTASPPPALSKKSGSDESRDRLLAAETAQLADLRRLAQSDPRRAVALADEGAHQFTNGFFSQEREAIAITSLLRLGREADARARAERFLVRYPRGPAAEKIRKAVGLNAN